MESNIVKVVIVDDEHLVRKLLKRCIDWNSIGMEIVGEASSGEEAIEVIDRYRPQLVFTDICMTNMDGIECADFIKKKYPRIKVVVISGYDDFKYAQRSIRAGIEDYLLKPINDEVVLKTALKVKKEIENEREVVSEYINLKKQFAESLPFLRERLFNSLIHLDMNIDEVKRQMDYLNFKFKHSKFQVAAMELILKYHDNYSKKETIYETKILDKLKDSLKKYDDINIFLDDDYRIVIIDNSEKNVLERAAQDLKDNIFDKFELYYCIGIGSTKIGIENIKESYKEALEAINYRLIMGQDSIIKYSNISLCTENHVNTSIEIDDKLKVYFLSGSKEKVQGIIDDIFEKKDMLIGMSKNTIKEYAFGYISIIFEVLKEFNRDAEEFHLKKYNIYKSIFELDTIQDIKKYVTDISSKALEIVNYHKSKKSSKLIDDIIEYIKLNLGDSQLSLAKAAKVFFVNPSYLSRIFKKEMDINFMEYLSKIRIDKAIMLISNTDFKAYEISEKVGFSDSSYFSTCFKRYTGVSVSEYRKAKLNR
ncbi:response regulator [Clostridium neuense]|uniref:Stage 0 sporulation protein A homolog n=1 Tax=Clostridium neuense TaxID=1728934 RepID=A0ABW8TJF5_9CLOT